MNHWLITRGFAWHGEWHNGHYMPFLCLDTPAVNDASNSSSIRLCL